MLFTLEYLHLHQHFCSSPAIVRHIYVTAGITLARPSPRHSNYSVDRPPLQSYIEPRYWLVKEGVITMPTFSSRPHAPSESTQRFQAILKSLRKRPFLLFGAPFLSLMVVSSFALQNLTKTRYDYQSSKTSTMTMEEGLGMNKDRKRVDIREEYFVSRLARRIVEFWACSVEMQRGLG